MTLLKVDDLLKGPGPVISTYDNETGSVLAGMLFVTGTAYLHTPGIAPGVDFSPQNIYLFDALPMGMWIKLNGNPLGGTTLMTNLRNCHQTLPTFFMMAEVDAGYVRFERGRNTVEIAASPGTHTVIDGNDHFQVIWIAVDQRGRSPEFPPAPGSSRKWSVEKLITQRTK